MKSERQKRHLEKLANLNRKREKYRINKQCKVCGKKFLVIRARKDAIYCSRHCYGIDKRGKPPWNKGKPAWNKGKTSENKGKSYDDIYGRERAIIERQKRSVAQKGRIMPTGENASNWKGGLSSENHKIRTSKGYRDFIKEIMRRDRFTCQRCGKNGGDLEVHHWKSFKEYPKLRFNFDNVSTLCEDCHKVVDRYRH